MLKTIAAGEGTCKDVAEYLIAGDKRDEGRGARLQAYLAGDASASRALAFGASHDSLDDQLDWHEVMRVTRESWGKDKPTEAFEEKMARDPNLKWRNYYHWVISPAPDDRASAEEVAEVSREWCERAWPPEDGWQWVFSVHNDNASRIMHAHVVLNAVNADTGYKVQLNDRRNDELASIMQEIAAEHGMDALPALAARRRALRREKKSWTGQWQYQSGAERAMRRRGARSWVAETRDAVDRAVGQAGSFEEFRELMEAAGFRVEWSRRGLGFRHPDSTGHDKKVMAERLGTDYTEDGLRARISFDYDNCLLEKSRKKPERHQGIKMYAHGLDEARGPLKLSDWISRQMHIGLRRRMADMQGLIDAAALIKEKGITSTAELRMLTTEKAEVVKSLEAEVRTLEEGTRQALDLLESAKRLDCARLDLKLLPQHGFLGAETRKRRNALLAMAAEEKEFCRRSLQKAQGLIAERGLEDADELEQARAVLAEINRRSNAAGAECERRRRELEPLRRAESQVDYLAGRRARPIRPRSGVVYAPMPSRAEGRALCTPTAAERRAAWEEQERAVRQIQKIILEHEQQATEVGKAPAERTQLRQAPARPRSQQR